MTGNTTLAAQARALADAAAGGSLQRRAAGCVAVALHTTGSLAGARKVLGIVGPDDVRQAAIELLDQITSNDNTEVNA